MPQPTPAGEDPKGPTPHANPRQGSNNRGPRPQQMPSHHHHHQHRQQARAGPPPPPVPGFGAPPPHFGAPLPILGAPPGFGALPPHLAAPHHGFAAPPGFAPQLFQQRQQQPIHIDPAILALQHQRLPLQAPFAPVPHPVSMNLRVGPAGANESVRVGGVPVQQSRNVGQPTPQLFGQPSVRVSGMPLPPPPPPQQAAPVEEAPLPQRSIKPDDALVQQFLERYEHQEEHEAITGAPVGFLDVDACLAVIEANDVTFVVTDTGTGKSSLVPKALMDIPGARIANSQPRRTAAVNLASRVSHLRNEEVGTEVGYWVRGERCGDINKCHLMYMTSYTLLLHLIDHHEDMNFTHIIIDEFHERQPDVEVMLGLLKLAVSTKRWKVKIILMSASVELELWKQYFDGLKVGEYSTCQPRYSIHDYYMEEVCRMIGAANTAQPFKDGTASSLQLKNSLFLVKEMLKFLAQHAEPKDSILVFLPGRTVVEEITQWVATNLATQLDPIPWYRDMELAKIQASLRRPATTRKKVYLATDIAEVSLTLPDVVFVVDSGFTKKPRIDPSKRNSVVFPPLEMIWCSRSSNRQRRGRVGRVQQGFFFTMTPESYLSELVDMEPQIANSTIHELSLHTLQLCRNPIGCFNLCRVKPKRVSLQHSMAILLDGGYALKNDHPFAASEGTEVEVSKLWNEFILGSEENKDLRGEMYVTTLKGRIAQRLPLNLESSTMVYYGVVFGLENLMILAAAITSCGTPFYTIPAENDRSQKLKAIKSTANVIKSYSFGLPSDVIAALGVTIAFKKQRCAGLSEDGEEHWCLENCVMRSRLGDILRLEDQIKDQLSAQIPFVDVKDPEDQETLLTRYAALVSLLAAGSHLERALFVENEPRTAQREKRVGPSIFLGLDALSDLFVASVCPWNVQSVVVPLSIQTKYGKLLGNFATQLQPKVFNVMLLLLAPQITYEIRDEEVLFEVELYHTKLCMRCDPLTGNDIIRTRQTMCAKMVIMRHQMMKQVSPTDESLDGVLAASGINLPQSVSKALDVSPFLRFIVDKINNIVATEFGRDVSPAPRATYRPQKWSILVSAGNGILTFVPPAPPVPTTTLDDGNATTTETFVEGDDE